MRRWSGGTPRRAALAFALMALVAGCKEKRRIRRSGDAGAAVESVDPSGDSEVLYTPEREPNDTEAAASALAVPGGAQGSLEGEADVDVYRIDIAADGMLHLELDGSAEADLILELRDSTGAVVARSDRGPVKIAEGLPNAPVTKGTYYAAVRAFVKPRKPPKKKGGPDAGSPPEPAGPAPAYKLSARLEAPQPLAEREPNGDTGAAGDLYLADQVKGWIGWTGDVDVWKLSLEALGAENAMDIEVVSVPGLVLTVEVLDAAGRPLIVRKGAKDGPVAIRSFVAATGEGAPPFHYIKISADRSNPADAYTLKITPRLLDLDEETEPNDVPEKASALRTAAAGTDSGTLRAQYVSGDVDHFLLDASPTPTLLDVTVEAPEGVDIIVEIRAQGGAGLGQSDAGKAGERERLSGVTIPAGTPVVIAVKAKPGKGDSGEPREYQVRWSLSPADDSAPMPPEEPP